jgi:hypothetical protein
VLRRPRIRTSLLEVVAAIAAATPDDDEVVATAVRMLRDGRAVMHTADAGDPVTRSGLSRF